MKKSNTAAASRAKSAKADSSAKTAFEPFPIAGIGASAGGLEALEKFLRNVPEPCGIAFVIVQHLDPTHKGVMPELLQRATAMKVVQVKDRTRVKPDCVYVIPPNKDMSILHGVLHLFKPAAPRGLRLPIDFFLNSLADDQRERSIGIILSGMGSDGTSGLRMIKGNSGLVVVQEPASAKFDSMPRSAIETGLVDIVAPAEALPAKILSFVHHVPVISGLEPHLENRHESAIDKITILLRDRAGHDFSLYKKNSLYRRIERRMAIHQIDRTSTYVRFLQNNPQELDILFRELLIGVTSFFRDPGEWEQLAADVLPMLLAAQPAGATLRAWSAGCSTGEEAYSLAMIFKETLERLKPSPGYSLQIFATDLDQGAIDKARRGFYPINISSNVSPERLRRFFVEEENGYRIGREIREMVTFATQNVIMDPPFTKLDLLICRNLLIYLEPELQKKLLLLFHYSLHPRGILFLGNSETVGNSKDIFTSRPANSRFFSRREAVLLSQPISFPVMLDQPRSGVPQEFAMPDPATNLQTLADQLLLRDYAPPAVLTGNRGDILYISGRTGKYLEPASGKANWNIFVMAREGLRFELTSAFQKAVRENKAVVVKNTKISDTAESGAVDLSIQPIENPEALRGMVLITFRETSLPSLPKVSAGGKSKTAASARTAELEQDLERCREELQATREGMQSTQEELKTMNEELQSTNEELQSTNEELTTSKEELQSMNEELQTVNAEQQASLDKMTQVNNDMENLLNGTSIITIFLNNELQIQRFTSGANKLFKLIPSDVGRPLSDIASVLQYPELTEDAREVLRTLVFSEKQIITSEARWYSVRIMPYRTLDNRIEGVVITFTDISAAKKLETQLRTTGSMLRALVQAAPFPLIALSADGLILEFNPQTEQLLGHMRDQVVGQNYFELFIAETERSQAKLAMQDLLSASPRQTFVSRVRTGAGRHIKIQWSARPMLDEDGGTTGILAIGQSLPD